MRIQLNIYTRLNVLIYTNVFIVKQSAHFYFRTINAVVLLLPNQNPPCKMYNHELKTILHGIYILRYLLWSIYRHINIP